MIDTADLHHFIQRYNRFAGVTSVENFVLFYSEFIDSLFDDVTLRDEILQVIRTYVERIRMVDDLIDNEKLLIKDAFPIVFPELYYYDNISNLQNTNLQEGITSTTAYHLMEKADNIVKSRFYSVHIYRLLVKEGLDRIYRYGEREAIAERQGIQSEVELESLLLEYNCDFYLHNSLIFDLFLSHTDVGKQSLFRKALSHYLVIDGILDSLCDLFEDYKNRSFNFLIAWQNQQLNWNLRRSLWGNGTYGAFFDIAQKHYRKAKELLEQIRNPKLVDWLSYNLEGAWEGLRIAHENDFFVDTDPKDITDEELLLYKPHPWEVIDGKEVLRKQRQCEDEIQKGMEAILPDNVDYSVEYDQKSEQQQVEAYYQSVHDKSLDKDVIILRTSGCTKGLRQNDKCHHCGICKSHFTSARCPDDVFESFLDGFSELNLSKVAKLGIYCLGSFFDDDEVTPETREKIYECIKEQAFHAKVIFESHPKYINKEKIAHLRHRMPIHRVAVGVGFDAKNDFIRNVILNKSISVKMFETAVATLKEFGVEVIGYVCLKPPFLSEFEGICEATRTGRYMHELGADTISIEPLAVQVGTLPHALWRTGRYKVPWLWSAVEAAQRLRHSGSVVIGGLAFLPIPVATVRNCVRCTQVLLSEIKKWNDSGQISKVRTECDCRETWASIIEGQIGSSGR